ncbi:polysaccharide transporter, PST family [Microlunatus sagamiharensis]|uniref:Polysaccharide transporter, PST family n=1 Tax=Microlunatus sagamiharensis TaxID=546874 RepID=A0A1H2LUG1_9ACTN|nr:oligosaccharide flippase family protein [Microlunatus sagamiharensis]SDU84338.1 polysaccharide transporter, PST family [Microlunatus sagamiharensis]
MTTTTPAPGGLTARATGALRWSFLNTVVSKLGTMAVGIALARMLGPAEFGTFAVATVALTAVLSFNELGVSLAIVRWSEEPGRIAPTVASLSLAMSALMTGAMVLLAPWFCAVMGSPGSTPVVRVMALSVLLSGLVATPAALMQREFRQRERVVVDQLGIWLGAACSLGLALAGLGAMSLAVGRVVGAAATAAGFARLCPEGFRLGLRRDLLPGLLGFGLPLAGTSILVFAVGYVDQVVAGSRLGATTLGFYVLAFNLSSWPVFIFSLPLRTVGPAVFARLRGDVPATRTEFRRLLALLASASLPVCALIAGAAEPLVRLVYGSAWLPAALALQLLGLGAAARIFGELAYDYLVINGRSRSLLVVQAVWLAVLVPALLIGSHEGLRGVAGAQLAVMAVVLPIYVGLLRRHGLTLGDVVLPVALPGAVALLLLVATSALSAAISSPLVACLACGGVATIGALALLWRQRASLTGLVDTRRTA